MATHSSILAWKIPWKEEPGRLQFIGSQRVRHERNANENYNEVSPHTSQNSHCQILYKEPKLERVWRNEKRPSSMLECQLGTATMETVCMYAKSLQSCLTLCDPMDCNLPDSSVHGILQSRILE